MSGYVLGGSRVGKREMGCEVEQGDMEQSVCLGVSNSEAIVFYTSKGLEIESFLPRPPFECVCFTFLVHCGLHSGDEPRCICISYSFQTSQENKLYIV